MTKMTMLLAASTLAVTASLALAENPGAGSMDGMDHSNMAMGGMDTPTWTSETLTSISVSYDSDASDEA